MRLAIFGPIMLPTVGADMMEWITLAAIALGPIAAVFVTRFIDARRERHERRMAIFRDLMRTRRNPLVPDFVGALNLIEIEFPKDTVVLQSFKDLMKHFGTDHARRADERDDNVEDATEGRIRDERFFNRLGTERAALIAKLLHAVAKALKFKIEQLEIFEGGYSPQGWHNIETEQSAIRRYVIDLALGRRVVPIGIVDLKGGAPEKDETPSLPASSPAPVEAKPKARAARRETK